MRFSSKSQFVSETEKQWQLLWELVNGCGTSKKSQRQLKQILAHLHAWHRLLLTWISSGRDETPDLPAPGFNWRQTHELNRKLDAEFDPVEMASVRRRLKLSHGRVMKMVARLSDGQFLESGHFCWTGKNAIASYIAPNTVSHYRWAIKKIKKLRSS